MSSNKYFDDILVSLQTGKWNLLHFFAVGLATFMIPSFVMSGAFLSPQVQYECKPPPEEGEILSRDECSYSIAKNWTKESEETVTEVLACANWNFSRNQFGESLTSEFSLVCDLDYLRPTFQTVYMFGFFFSSPINGMLSDRYGRRTLLAGGFFLSISSALLSSFMNDIILILILRFITGLAHPPLVQSGYILAMEVCQPKYRSHVGILIALPWALGTMWFGLLGYLIKDWRWLQRATLIPGVLYILFFMCFLDESPRWLIVRGFHQKALKVLRKAEKANKVALPNDEVLLSKMKQIEKNSLSESKKEENGPKLSEERNRIGVVKEFITRIFILYKTPELRRRTFLLYTVFIVSSTVYYGLSLNATNLKLNPFLYMVVNGIMEVPAYTVTVPIITRVGRVKPSSVSYFICGVTIMALAFIPTDFKWLVISLSMIGKLFISAAYQVIYLMSSEIFPTEIRLQAMGTCSFVSRIGSIIAPYVTDSLGPIYPWIPSVLFGSLSLVAGFASIFIPETLNTNLHETIIDLEEEARAKKLHKTNENGNNLLVLKNEKEEIC